MKRKLMFGDCLERMKEIPDNSVDLVVTSPPYDNIRDYNNSSKWDFEVFKNISSEIFRVMKMNGVVVWIVNDSTIKGSETGSSFKQALHFKDIGFNIHDTMIWQKISPFQHKNRYIQCFEYMFVFTKGFKKEANLIKDRKNKWAGTKVHGTERQQNGKTKNFSITQKSKTIKEFGTRYNVWDMPPDKANKTGHPAVFPIKIVSDHIATWSDVGQTVMDPFMGSGTTGLACKNLQRNFIGIENDKEYFKIAKQRINDSSPPPALI
jgi:DNA modification methylase